MNVLSMFGGISVRVEEKPWMCDRVRRTWRERLWSRPWRPWRAWKTVPWDIVYKVELRPGEILLVCHPAKAERLREQLAQLDGLRAEARAA